MPLRTDRRRRVLADDLLTAASTDDLPMGSEPLQGASGMRYAPAARRENQPRLVDFVPIRALPFTLIVAMGLIVIATLLSAHAWLGRLSEFLPADSLAPLDLATEHSLATWFASLLLLSNMQLALLVYSVRKHRVDDYHARYRVWLAVAAASLVISVNLATGIERLFQVALAPAARWCRVAEHYSFWCVLGVIATYLTVRLVLETRRSSLTLGTLVFAAISLALPSLLRSSLISFELPAHAVMFRVGFQLLGYLLLLVGTMLFARHVLLDVEGKLPERKPKKAKPPKVKKAKPEKRKSPEAETAAATARAVVDPPQRPKPHIGTRTDLDSKPRPAPVPRPTFVPSKPIPPVSSQEDDEDEDDDNSTDLRNLSRAERKRLKREAKLARRTEAVR